jgi:hypothetical protein
MEEVGLPRDAPIDFLRFKKLMMDTGTTDARPPAVDGYSDNRWCRQLSKPTKNEAETDFHIK